MAIIFEGDLAPNFSMQDVLKKILSIDKPSGVLHISSDQANLDGRLSIINSHSIVNVGLNRGETTGYQAIQNLLQLEEGRFAYLEAPNRKQADGKFALCLSIEKIIEMLPDLPTDATALFDEKYLLDKIFGHDEKPLSDQAPGDIRHSEPEEDTADSSNNRLWSDLIRQAASAASETQSQPLLNGAGVATVAKSRMPSFVSSISTLDSSTSDYKNDQPDSQTAGTHPALAAIMVILLVALATLCGLSALNRQTSLTIQKGTPPTDTAPIERSGRQTDAHSKQQATTKHVHRSKQGVNHRHRWSSRSRQIHRGSTSRQRARISIHRHRRHV